MSIWVIVGLGIACAVVGGIIQGISTSGEMKKLTAALAATRGFQASHVHVAMDGSCLLAFDSSSNALIVIRNSQSGPIRRPIDRKQIIGSQIIEDGQSITETRRASQIGGAIVGGVLLGGVGAVIGGLSGKKRSVSEVDKLSLRITVENATHPMIDIPFLTLKQRADSSIYRQLRVSIDEWHGRIAALIRQADREQPGAIAMPPSPPALPAVSVADELLKLAALRDSGVLSPDEFASEKQRLLARS